ncbi:uncharacterized protein I303_100176 [Kwoniella dejecticola CBS 10117]|uniref:Ubiquitin carboxyl-terminal hydrolase n=1 Tax=Kwoniella dejecticola CBS 10117 TaxID=1296121 RepID=A0A1A6AE94_9TREE|nr:uncharacterized protein I303_00178 [Kwoniella dejecticola CBS 10117]OBR88364.1 hypothetical protein I303_00178 [Kwoniella dejecticola CBS 10117]
MTTLSQPPAALHNLGNNDLYTQFTRDKIPFGPVISKHNTGTQHGVRVVENGPPSPPPLTKKIVNGSSKTNKLKPQSEAQAQPQPRARTTLVNGEAREVGKSSGNSESEGESEEESEREEGGKGRSASTNGYTKSDLPNGTNSSKAQDQEQKQLPTPEKTQPSSSSSTAVPLPLPVPVPLPSPKHKAVPASPSSIKASSNAQHAQTTPTSTLTPITTPPTKKQSQPYQPPIHPDDLHQVPISLAWPEVIMSGERSAAAGLYNPGMACYANATLQVLLHTPPVLSMALDHQKGQCLRSSKNSNQFCMLCALHDMATGTHWQSKSTRHAYAPAVHGQLKSIKKGFSKMRQEDTHEFFRFVTDALQLSALAGKPKDLPEKIKHSSWVYKVWGGRVRSRVVCSRCNKPSDTFDWFLDLSLDVNKKGPKSISNMMNGFTREDRLEGDNKYHCDNCKAKANATKSFKIAECPPILTLHLKRFSVEYSRMGRVRANKYNDHIEFGEYLDVGPYMVDPKAKGTKYRLFGVTCHHGTELRHGHYTSYVKGPHNQWFDADDDSVSPVKLAQVLKSRSAYLLSYIRLDGAVPHPTPLSNRLTNGHVASASPLSKNISSGTKRARSETGSESDDGNENRVNELKPRKSINGSLNGVNGTPRSMTIRKATPPSSLPGGIRGDRPDEREKEDVDSMPPELPTKFGALMQSRSPKTKMGSYMNGSTSSSSNSPSKKIHYIHQPKAITPGQFQGAQTKSPIQRIAGPGPDANLDYAGSEDPSDPISSFSRSHANSHRDIERGMSKKQRKKENRAMKKARHRGDNPYDVSLMKRKDKSHSPRDPKARFGSRMRGKQ